MNTVTISNVAVNGERIDGEYEIVSQSSATVTIEHPKFGRKIVSIKKTNLSQTVSVSSTYNTQTYKEIKTDISKRFNVLERLVSGVINSTINSLIVTGAPGVGKTYTIESMLYSAAKETRINAYKSIKGTLSPIMLYMLLWEYRDKGNVLVIDDTDTIFDNLDGLNILKAALDTGQRRTISYLKKSIILEEEGIPNSFDFCGNVIFVSNIDFDDVSRAGGKLSPHVNALMSRSLYVDLGLHTPLALMARIEEVCTNGHILGNYGLDSQTKQAIVEWIKENRDHLRSLSLRTAMQLAQLASQEGDWESFAKVTMLRK